MRELYHTLQRAYLMGGGRITAELLENEMGAEPTPGMHAHIRIAMSGEILTVAGMRPQVRGQVAERR